jgi:hypothetical protein
MAHVAPGAFAQQLATWINQAAGQTGLNPVAICVQWGLETGWYTEGVWQSRVGWHGRYNLAGIMAGSSPQDFADYEMFVQDYARLINYYKSQGWGAPWPDNAATDPVASLEWLARTPWNGDHYAAGGVWGKVLLDVYDAFGEQIAAALQRAAAPAAATVTVTVLVPGYVPLTLTGTLEVQA